MKIINTPLNPNKYFYKTYFFMLKVFVLSSIFFFILHKIRYNQQIFINHSNITRSLAHFVDTRVRLLKEKLIP